MKNVFDRVPKRTVAAAPQPVLRRLIVDLPGVGVFQWER